MKDHFVYLFIVLILLCSCKNETQKIAEIQKSKTDTIENQTDSLKIKSKQEIGRPCELRTIKITDSLLRINHKMDSENYAVFFANMRIDCAQNAEYSQWNNELIFKVLEENPKMFVAFLSRVSRKKELMSFVLEELKNPINDKIELEKITTHLKRTETEDENTKQNVLKSLNHALQREK